jgi:PIN domain nuclease of toxin-antitoxin system
VRVLLDTQVFLWLLARPERIVADVRALLAAPTTTPLLSAASSWEIAIKHGIGRLPLPDAPDRYVPSRMQRLGVEALDVTHHHALAVGRLPSEHRDPFDRLLAAQAIVEGIPLVTADPAFEALGASTIAATRWG